MSERHASRPRLGVFCCPDLDLAQDDLAEAKQQDVHPNLLPRIPRKRPQILACPTDTQFSGCQAVEYGSCKFIAFVSSSPDPQLKDELAIIFLDDGAVLLYRRSAMDCSVFRASPATQSHHSDQLGPSQGQISSVHGAIRESADKTVSRSSPRTGGRAAP